MVINSEASLLQLIFLNPCLRHVCDGKNNPVYMASRLFMQLDFVLIGNILTDVAK